MWARLSWRLLAIPRLLLAFGVIVVAVFVVVLTGWRRKPQPARRPPTSGDPVGDALAGARPVSRDASYEVDPGELRRIVTVNELEVTGEESANTVVLLDDEASCYADVYADGMEDALLDQPGIDSVFHQDREVLLVRSTLSLPDVQAAAIRALLAINRQPMTPRDRCLPKETMDAIESRCAAILAGHGFSGRIPRGRYRLLAQEGLVQVVMVRDDEGHLMLTAEIVEVDTTGAPQRVLTATFDAVPATADGAERILTRKALPLCESTASRAAIVDRWVRGLPWSVPDRLSWEAADVAARWGFRKHARDLLKHSPRLPQTKAVAAKHGL